MRVKERSDYGERLFQARRHARLTQAQLAQKAGLSQSNLAELEHQGQGSARTPQIAKATGVRVDWLADGEGEMLAEPEVPAAAARLASDRVAPYLINSSPGGSDYRTVALTLADALEEAGTTVTIRQFIKLVDATHARLSRHEG